MITVLFRRWSFEEVVDIEVVKIEESMVKGEAEGVTVEAVAIEKVVALI
ncbi:MAG TPA: hypothetical protein VFC41_06235 [Anaerovoracaceae bacterium]|nr:hypothetical protein [Anaerovoracaceae bacterium]